MASDPSIKGPNLFVVGAPRCGTTAMHDLLAQHPDIFMSLHKEPHFFNSDINRRFVEYQGQTNDPLIWDIEPYLRLFDKAGAEAYRGESSVYYLFSPEAVQRIAKFNPDARIVIMLRDPLEFQRSLHARLRLAGDESCVDFARAMDLEPERRAGRKIPSTVRFPEILFYSRCAEFSRWIAAYQAALGADQVKVVLLEDMQADPQGSYSELLKFLGVADRPVPQRVDRNANREPRFYCIMRYLFTRGRRRSMGRFHGRLERWNTRPAVRRELKPADRERLRAALLPEVQRLSQMLDRDLVEFWGYGGLA
jgi:hypothetical protein